MKRDVVRVVGLALGAGTLMWASTTTASAQDDEADVNEEQPTGDSKEAKKEKCYGVVAKGMNDCAGAGHGCAGQAEVDHHPEEWMYVPAGMCERLAGASKEPKKD